MQSPAAEPFRRVVKEVAGLSGKGDKVDSLMSSLPSELVFNSLRDCARRHSKAEKTAAPNLHSAAARSVTQQTARVGNLSTVELSDKDWAEPLPNGKNVQVKASVHSAMRQTDVSLGVSSDGLTRHKNSKAFTKPHILAQRFEAFSLLCQTWASTEGGEHEDRCKVVQSTLSSMWLCKLVSPQLFIRLKEKQLGFSREDHRLVLASGPNCVKTLSLTASPDDVFVIGSNSIAALDRVLLRKLEDVEAS